MLLTIGMASFRDVGWLTATLQALRIYHDLEDCELLVADNAGDPNTKKFCENAGAARYLLANEVQGTAYPRQRLFEEARGRWVLCIDSHVFLFPGALARLKAYLRANPDSRDLLSGPLRYDPLHYGPTQFKDSWGAGMWGQWDTDPRGDDSDGPPFEIWAMGLGLFCCRKAAWPGFNPAFRGFGGEEVYIHEKVRRAGGRCLCLPWLKWWHYFRPEGERPPYRLDTADKFRNYLIGHKELGIDPTKAIQHFISIGLSLKVMQAIVQEVYDDNKMVWQEGEHVTSFTEYGLCKYIPTTTTLPPEQTHFTPGWPRYLEGKK